jgi:glutamate:GABA antiporter
MAEVGSAFTQEGGPYEWTKLAFGRLQGTIAAVLYWVTNPCGSAGRWPSSPPRRGLTTS